MAGLLLSIMIAILWPTIRMIKIVWRKRRRRPNAWLISAGVVVALGQRESVVGVIVILFNTHLIQFSTNQLSITGK